MHIHMDPPWWCRYSAMLSSNTQKRGQAALAYRLFKYQCVRREHGALTVESMDEVRGSA